MSQTEILMILALGFCLALITAMLLSRFVWNIGQKISRHRIARERPTEIRDLEADRDQLRASQAMLGRKYLNQIEDLKANAVAHQAEVSRHRNRVQSLIEESNAQRTELDLRQDKIAELNNHVDLLDSEVKDRGTQIANLSTELAERNADSTRLLNTLSEREAGLTKLASDLTIQEANNERLAATLTEREAERMRLVAALNERESDNARLSTELSNMSGLLDQSNSRLRQIDNDLAHALTKSEEVTRQHQEAVNQLTIQREHAAQQQQKLAAQQHQQKLAAQQAQERQRPAYTPAEAQQALHQSFKSVPQQPGPTGDRADILMSQPTPRRFNFDAPASDPQLFAPQQPAQPIDPDSDIARMMNAARRSMQQSQQQLEENTKNRGVANVVAIAQRMRAQKDES